MELTKFQIQRLEEELTSLLRRSDKLEDKQYDAELANDTEKAHKLECKDNLVVGQIDGIRYVLQILGYKVRYNQDDSYTILG